MKLVKEILYEKFTDESDPIHDLGIGIYAHRNFNSVNTFLKFMLIAIPVILKTEQIPEDIIDEDDELINDKYFKAIDNYLEKYISFKNISMRYNECKIYAWNDIIPKYLMKIM